MFSHHFLSSHLHFYMLPIFGWTARVGKPYKHVSRWVGEATKFHDCWDSQKSAVTGCCLFQISLCKWSLRHQGGVSPTVEWVWREVMLSETTEIQKCFQNCEIIT